MNVKAVGILSFLLFAGGMFCIGFAAEETYNTSVPYTYYDTVEKDSNLFWTKDGVIYVNSWWDYSISLQSDEWVGFSVKPAGRAEVYLVNRSNYLLWKLKGFDWDKLREVAGYFKSLNSGERITHYTESNPGGSYYLVIRNVDQYRIKYEASATKFWLEKVQKTGYRQVSRTRTIYPYQGLGVLSIFTSIVLVLGAIATRVRKSEKGI